MQPNEVFRRALTWLRSKQAFSTHVLPDDALDPDGAGTARVQGWIVRPSAAGTWSFVGLCGLLLGAVLMMFNPSAVETATKSSVNRAGHAVTGGAVGCLAVAESLRRRNRTRAVVELRSGKAPATAASVEALRRTVDSPVAWIVSEGAFTPETLAKATQRHVRCVVLDAGGFQEVVAADDRGAGNNA